MAFKDRLNTFIRPIQMIWLSVQLHLHALKQALRNNGLVSLTRLGQIRDAAIANLFITHSDGFISYENTTCVPSLVRSAQGKILELGPGPGNQIHRYDPSQIDFIYAVEPNTFYKEQIAAKAKQAGIETKYKLLGCGVEDSDVLLAEGITEGSMDTILSIQVLCAVGDVQNVMRAVWKLLKPGGWFIFWEHVKNKDTATAMTQGCLNPAWSSFLGCSLNRHIKEDILDAGEWENPGDIEVADEPYSPLPRIWGVLIKKA